MGYPEAAEAPNLERATMLLLRYFARLSVLVAEIASGGSSSNHQLQLLSTLFDQGARRPGELAQASGLSRSGVARLVGALERDGLVERRSGRSDRRTVLTSLTGAGRRRMTEFDDALARHFQDSGPEAETIVSLLWVAPPAHELESRSDSTRAVAHRMGVVRVALTESFAALGVVDGVRPQLVLSALAVEGAARPRRLGDLLGITSGGMTAVVDRLESEGLVERTYGLLRGDRRGVLIDLTDDGRAQARSMGLALSEYAVAVTEVLSASLALRSGGPVERAGTEKHGRAT